jgi:hypothetical protein
VRGLVLLFRSLPLAAFWVKVVIVGKPPVGTGGQAVAAVATGLSGWRLNHLRTQSVPGNDRRLVEAGGRVRR